MRIACYAFFIIASFAVNVMRKGQEPWQQAKKTEFVIPDAQFNNHRQFIQAQNIRYIPGMKGIERAKELGFVLEEPLQGNAVANHQFVPGRTYITKKLPGAQFKIVSQETQDVKLEPSDAKFKSYKHISLKQDEIQEVFQTILKKIKKQGLAEKFDKAGTHAYLAEFLDSIPEALDSIDHNFAIEKLLLNFVSSFKHLFLQLDNLSKVAPAGVALINQSNFDDLFATYKEYVEAHDNFCSKVTKRNNFCDGHEENIRNLFAGFMTFAKFNKLNFNYNRKRLVMRVFERTVIDFSKEIKRKIIKLQRFKGTLPYDQLLTIYQTVLRITSGEGVSSELESALSKLTNELSAILETSVKTTLYQKGKSVAAVSFSHANAQSGVKLTTKFTSILKHLIASNKAFETEINTIMAQLGKLSGEWRDPVTAKPGVFEEWKALRNQQSGDVEWIIEDFAAEQNGQSNGQNLIKNNRVVQIEASSQEEMDRIFKREKDRMERENKAAQLKINVRTALLQIKNYIDAIHESSNMITKFPTIKLSLKTLKQVYQIALKEPYLLADYVKFESFYRDYSKFWSAISSEIRSNSGNTYHFLTIDKIGYAEFVIGLQRFIDAFKGTGLNSHSLASLNALQKAFGKQMSKLPEIDVDTYLEAIGYADYNYYFSGKILDPSTRKFVVKTSKVVVNEVKKEVRLGDRRRKEFESKFGNAMWSGLYSNGNKLYGNLIDLLNSKDPALKSTGIDAKLPAQITLLLNKARLRAENPRKGYSGRVTLELVPLRNFMRTLDKIERLINKAGTPKDKSIAEKFEEIKDSIELLRNWRNGLFFDGVIFSEFKNPKEVSVYYPACNFDGAAFNCPNTKGSHSTAKKLIDFELKEMESLEEQGHEAAERRFFKATKKVFQSAKKALQNDKLPADKELGIYELLSYLPNFWRAFSTHEAPFNESPIKFVSLGGREVTAQFIVDNKFLNAFDPEEEDGDDTPAFNELKADVHELQSLIAKLPTAGHEFFEFDPEIDAADIEEIAEAEIVPEEELVDMFNGRAQHYREKTETSPLKFPANKVHIDSIPTDMEVEVPSEVDDNDEFEQPQFQGISESAKLGGDLEEEDLLDDDLPEDEDINLENDLLTLEKEDIPLSPEERSPSTKAVQRTDIVDQEFDIPEDQEEDNRGHKDNFIPDDEDFEQNDSDGSPKTRKAFKPTKNDKKPVPVIDMKKVTETEQNGREKSPFIPRNKDAPITGADAIIKGFLAEEDEPIETDRQRNNGGENGQPANYVLEEEDPKLPAENASQKEKSPVINFDSEDEVPSTLDNDIADEINNLFSKGKKKAVVSKNVKPVQPKADSPKKQGEDPAIIRNRVNDFLADDEEPVEKEPTPVKPKEKTPSLELDDDLPITGGQGNSPVKPVIKGIEAQIKHFLTDDEEPTVETKKRVDIVNQDSESLPEDDDLPIVGGNNVNSPVKVQIDQPAKDKVKPVQIDSKNRLIKAFLEDDEEPLNQAERSPSTGRQEEDHLDADDDLPIIGGQTGQSPARKRGDENTIAGKLKTFFAEDDEPVQIDQPLKKTEQPAKPATFEVEEEDPKLPALNSGSKSIGVPTLDKNSDFDIATLIQNKFAKKEPIAIDSPAIIRNRVNDFLADDEEPVEKDHETPVKPKEKTPSLELDDDLPITGGQGNSPVKPVIKGIEAQIKHFLADDEEQNSPQKSPVKENQSPSLELDDDLPIGKNNIAETPKKNQQDEIDNSGIQPLFSDLATDNDVSVGTPKKSPTKKRSGENETKMKIGQFASEEDDDTPVQIDGADPLSNSLPHKPNQHDFILDEFDVENDAEEEEDSSLLAAKIRNQRAGKHPVGPVIKLTQVSDPNEFDPSEKLIGGPHDWTGLRNKGIPLLGQDGHDNWDTKGQKDSPNAALRRGSPAANFIVDEESPSSQPLKKIKKIKVVYVIEVIECAKCESDSLLQKFLKKD